MAGVPTEMYGRQLNEAERCVLEAKLREQQAKEDAKKQRELELKQQQDREREAQRAVQESQKAKAVPVSNIRSKFGQAISAAPIKHIEISATGNASAPPEQPVAAAPPSQQQRPAPVSFGRAPFTPSSGMPTRAPVAAAFSGSGGSLNLSTSSHGGSTSNLATASGGGGAARGTGPVIVVSNPAGQTVKPSSALLNTGDHRPRAFSDSLAMNSSSSSSHAASTASPAFGGSAPRFQIARTPAPTAAPAPAHVPTVATHAPAAVASSGMHAVAPARAPSPSFGASVAQPTPRVAPTVRATEEPTRTGQQAVPFPKPFATPQLLRRTHTVSISSSLSASSAPASPPAAVASNGPLPVYRGGLGTLAPGVPASAGAGPAAATAAAVAAAKAGGDVCTVCTQRVYKMEEVRVESTSGSLVFHNWCFRCTECGGKLSLGRYAAVDGKMFCKPHFKQLFSLKGNYNEGFGTTQRKHDFAHATTDDSEI
jgi:hypothetical protein